MQLAILICIIVVFGGVFNVLLRLKGYRIYVSNYDNHSRLFWLLLIEILASRTTL